ncbi:Na+/H+ antiporter subunit E [Candidatus Thiodiazotropha sp. CDECU1]|uniref:Na+/H+ antiporter subunit E n=1 Tax=Candidatus Thiodiazotropha sp. CDECU1 TaxID=3065865 RepID=UPI00293022A8|nr:Na+/H+ antiporter subunit E [Candidatus Thiodiazotropha sp. CDECU1]
MSENPAPHEQAQFSHGLFLFFLIFLLWIMLAGSLAIAEVGIGLMVAAVVTLTSRPHLALFSGLRLSISSIRPFLTYLGVFLAALIRANLDMARRVLSPSLPLRPGVVEVKTQLKSSLGRLILANSITLTPGTLTVDLEGDSILIHWVDIPPGSDVESATRDVISQFEPHLLGFVK